MVPISMAGMKEFVTLHHEMSLNMPDGHFRIFYIF